MVAVGLTPRGRVGHLLRVRHRGRNYQFQLKPDSYWRGSLNPYWERGVPFPVRMETALIEPPYKSPVMITLLGVPLVLLIVLIFFLR